MAPANGCRDHVILVSRKGGKKIEVFRHTSTDASGLSSLGLPSLQVIVEVLPSLLFVILCMAFIVQKSALCTGQTQTQAKLTKGLCVVSNSIPLSPLAGVLFVMMILKQLKKTMDRKNARAITKKTV